MNNFLKGLLVGAGIGLIVAPMRGEEMRNLIAQRFSELRNSLPDNPQLNQYTQQVTNTVSQGASNLKDYAQQAASTVKSSANNLSDIAQNAASTVKQTSQNVADTTKQTAANAKSNTTTSTTNPATNGTTTSAPFPSAYPEYVNPETNPNV
jgi:gas vesicle protein